MATTLTRPADAPHVGELLRQWRQRRRRSQLHLASEAAVSARHLSFVETGRSRPSRELVLHLADHLDVPLRERNTLLLAAGYAPTFPQTSLDAAEMAPVRRALDAILAGHRPFPAVVVDRHWDLVTANDAAFALLADGVAPHLLAPPVNVLRTSLHPEGLASRIVNFDQWSAHLIDRLRREADRYADPRLIELLDELTGYPGVVSSPTPADTVGRLFVPLVLRDGDGELRFFSTVATFGTARDITVEELAIESFFPADAATADALRALERPAVG
jgi:transcriptional regulator with XRE-family HTH domain